MATKPNEDVSSLFKGIERFEIKRRLGEGGMGVVYQAYDRERNELVALKTISNVSPALLYMFKQEFRALADVAHPNLVTLHELSSVNDLWFFTMEFIDGVNFLTYLRGAQVTGPKTLVTPDERTATVLPSPATPLSVLPAESASAPSPVSAGQPFPKVDTERLRAALRQLAEGLHALHSAGKLHRDIKPQNVLVSHEGRVVLLDFGLVEDLGRASGELRLLVGTPAYIAPEQFEGKGVSPASDWYSVGVMLYEALTGQKPHGARSPREVQSGAKQQLVVSPVQLAPGGDPALSALCEALLRARPEERPSGAEVLRLLGSAEPLAFFTERTPALVGRERHFQVLLDSFQRTREGRIGIAHVRGSSGIGKSALIRTFLDTLLRRERVVVLEGRCYEREAVPFKGLDDLVDALSRFLISLPAAKVEELVPKEVAALSLVFPVLQRVPQVASALAHGVLLAEPRELRRRAFSSLREMLTRIGARYPLVLYLDDLQWSDADSAALLVDLLAPPDPPVLLLLASYRDEMGASIVQTLRSGAGTSTDMVELSLEPLSTEQARALALDLLGRETEATRSQANAIVQHSAGNPFFVHEFVRYARESSDASASVTMEGLVAARLARLREEPRRLLEVVAVAGQPIPVALALQAAGFSAKAHAVLSELRGSHMVRVRALGGLEQVESIHDQIREGVVAALPPDARRDIHGRLATTLEASGNADPETLMGHFLGAGDKARGAHYAVLAARKAAASLAFDRAATFYRQALKAPPAEAAEARELRLQLAESLSNAGRCAEAAPLFQALAAEADSPFRRLEMFRRAAEQLVLSGHIDAGLQVIAQVLEPLGYRLSRTPRHALASLAGQMIFLKFRGIGFEPRPAEQLSDDELARLDTCWAVGSGLSFVDSIRAAEFQARHLRLALKVREPSRVARGLAAWAMTKARPGLKAEPKARALLRRAYELAEQDGRPSLIALATTMDGLVDYLTGRWRGTYEKCSRAEALILERCTGMQWELSSARRFALGSLMHMGRLREMGQRVRELLRAAREHGNLYAAMDLRTRFNTTWLAVGDLEGAERNLAEALSEWTTSGYHLQHYSALLARAQIGLYRGEPGAAHARVTEQWPALNGSLLLNSQVVRIDAVHLRARCTLAAGTASNDARLLASAEQDITRIEKEGADWALPWARLLRAGLLRARGDQEGARTLLVEAARSLEAVDMGLYAAAARLRAGELKGGDEGRAQVAAAEAWMKEQDIREPGRMVAVLAPGFPAS